MKEITLNEGLLEKIFSTTKNTIAIDDSRPVLKFIKIEVTDKNIKAISVDGYMLTTFEIPHEQNEVTPFECLVKPFNIPKHSKKVVINAEDKDSAKITIYFGDYQISHIIKQPDAEFINYQSVFPETNQNLSICFDARRLQSLLKGFKGYNRNCCVRFTFCGKDVGIDPIKPAVLEFAEDGVKTKSLILPMRTF